ncbi:RNA polymerase sigma factor [Kolteria novifilia]
MESYVGGDESCLTELIQRYESELFRYLHRMLGEPNLAEDVFQNTFLQVHLKRHLYEPGRPFRPWLYTIATHQAIDLIRRNKRHRRPSLDQEFERQGRDAENSMLQGLPDEAPEPEARALRRERRHLVRKAVDRLSSHLRQVVVLAYYQGLKYKEVSDILGIPVGTVKSRLHTAISRLGTEWTNMGLDRDT